MNIAVITGASSGMGRDFVYAIDKEFTLDEIWVIARREERLLELKKIAVRRFDQLHWIWLFQKTMKSIKDFWKNTNRKFRF